MVGSIIVDSEYRFPPEWETMSAREKSDWMTRWRVNRQALKQDTFTAKILQKQIDRMERRAEARSGSVSLEKYR